MTEPNEGRFTAYTCPRWHRDADGWCIAEAWDAGYAAAQLDADEEPYSDRPERATWQPRQNPHRAGKSA